MRASPCVTAPLYMDCHAVGKKKYWLILVMIADNNKSAPRVVVA
jgi:hypothetical protein